MNALLSTSPLFVAALGGSFMMPDAGSTFANGIDNTFYFIFWVAAFFFALTAVLMFTFMVLYRQRTPGEIAPGTTTHNTPLEVIWTVIPTLLVVVMFWWGYQTFMDMRLPPDNAFEVNVKAQKWSWQFTYPNGLTDGDLHVPVNVPVRLIMRSDDVLHACYIPAFRVKRDVVPGRYAELWFQATKAGDYGLYCAEYCGTSHSDMRARVHVYDPEKFAEAMKFLNPLNVLSPEQYQEFQSDPDAFIKKYSDDPAIGKAVQKLQTPMMMGADLYKKKGCVQCHSVNGDPGTGPTWKGAWGATHDLRDGAAVKVDENYVRDSIANPNGQIVKGFNAVMPKISITDREIDQIIAYMKSLKE